MSDSASLNFEGKEIKLPIITGSENEKAIDISKLRSETGLVTLDKGFKNTGSTTSNITYLDGEKGILRHRGYSCLLYTSPSPRDKRQSRMPSSA